MTNDPKFITMQCHANAVAEQALLAFYRPEVAYLHEKSMREAMAILAADMGYTLTPVAVAEKVTGFLEELRDFKPDVISGRAHDPQDDVDDLTPLNTFEAFQSDADDYGHENGIAAEYVDPVRITQKAMSDNLLTADAKAVA